MFLAHAISNTPIKRAVISGNAGDVEAVAAVSGRKIRCLHYYIHQSAAGTIRFESGAAGTALTGVMVTTAEGLVLKDSHVAGLFETLAGQSLSIEAGTGNVA